MNMPENDAAAERFAYEETFIQLVDASETRDFGLDLFERTMQTVENQLTERYKGDAYYSFIDLDTHQEALNDQWRYHGEPTTVTGRIYISDIDIVDSFPDEWGEGLTDENGDFYFFVENARLRSQGIEIIPKTDAEGDTREIKVAFTFSDVDDEEETPIYVAYIGELSKHEYVKLTPEEADLRLRRLWPKEHALLERYMRPNLNAALPRRLAMMTDRFQVLLRDSPDFREYISLVVNDKLALHATLPYAMQVTGSFAAFDGEDPYDPDDPGFWVELITKTQLPLVAHAPEIWFSEDDDLVVKTYFLVATYSDETEEPEFIRVEAGNVTGFQSSRSVRSLVSRALNAVEGAESFDPGEDAAAESLVEVAQTQDEAMPTIAAPAERRRTEPEYITDLKFLEKAYQEVAKIINAEREYSYPTEEEAYEAARMLVKGRIQDVLVGAGLQNGTYLYQFSGQSIVTPRTDKHINELDIPSHILSIGLNQKKPTKKLALGDTQNGYIHSIIPSVRQYSSEGEPDSYQINPALVVTTGRVPFQFYAWNDIPAIEALVETRIFVPLDGSAEIQLVELEHYRDIQAAMGEARRLYGKNTRIMSNLNTLKAAFAAEISEGTVLLEPLHILRTFDEALEREVQKGRSSDYAVAALEALFLHRVVELQGYAYPQEHSANLYDVYEELDEVEYLAGAVIDVRKASHATPTVLVVESADDSIFYVPLRHISALRF